MNANRRTTTRLVAATRFLIVTVCAALPVACSPTGSVTVESTDSLFVQQLAQTLDRQAAEARYVVAKGRAAPVRMFARDLLRSLGQDRTGLAQAAADAHVSVPRISTGSQDAAISLGVLSGAELDRAFMARQTIEQQVVYSLANAEQGTSASSLRAFARRIKVGTQRRLSVAQSYVNSRPPDENPAPGT
jgi:predicted outer membrane protein